VEKIDLKKELRHLYQPSAKEVVQVDVPMQFTLEGAGWFVERVVPIDDLTWIKAEWSQRVADLGKKTKT